MQLSNKWHICFCVVAIPLYSFFSCHSVQKQQKDTAQSKPASGYTVLQEKLDSHLLDRIASNKQLATPDTIAVASPKTGGKDSNVAVDIRAVVSDSLLENIKRLGGKILYPSKEYQTIRATVPVSKLEILANYKSVVFIATAAEATTNH